MGISTGDANIIWPIDPGDAVMPVPTQWGQWTTATATMAPMTKKVRVFFSDGGSTLYDLPDRFVGDTYYWASDGSLLPLKVVSKRADRGEQEMKEAMATIAAWRMLEKE